MRYRAFRTKKDNQFYFQFMTDGGDVVLKSQAYSSKADCFTGIRSVMDNADNADRYEAVPGDDGAFAFRLKAGNNVEIARSVGYGTEDEVKNMIALCQKEIPTANSGAAEKPKPEVTKSSATSSSSGSSGGGAGNKRGDDYRPLAFYQENITGVENGFDTCTDSDEWYFTYNMNGQIILISEGYNSEAGRDNGIASVTKNMTNPDRYKKGIHSNGKHFFGLRAGNHQEIATSRWCADEAEVDLTIQALTSGDASLLAPAMAKSMAPSGGDGHENDEYLGCDAYEGAVGFHSFEKDGEYYFGYNGGDGKTLLRSQGYKSEAARDNGIESVKKNGPIEKRWTMGDDNGTWYYALKAGNHQEIARSCDYSSEKDMKTAFVDARYAFEEKPEVVAAAAAPGHENDEYLGCDAYEGAVGFHSFEKDGEFYFGYNGGDGKTLLRSQGYKSEAARDNGIESVKTNGPIEKRWSMGDDNGTWYYILKAGNHQEIARSCDYSSEKDMKTAFVDARYAFEEKPEVVAAAAAPAAGHENDEYLACSAYAGAVGFHIFDKDGEYYFGYNDGNGKTLLRSQGYKSEAARDNGMESVKKNGSIEKRWSMGDDNGTWYYALKAGNHQEIARSCDYSSEKDMKTAFVDARFAFEDKPAPVVVKSSAAPVIEKVTETKTTAAAPSAASSKIPDDYMPCEAYDGGKPGFHTFFDENRKEYFFSYNDKDGNTLLRSEGYKSEAARDNGIESVKKNAPIEGRWKKETALNGKYHYYTLKAGNNQEIARSCYYEDNEQMNTNFMLLGGAFATVSGAGVASSMTSSSSSSSSSKVVKSTPPPVKKEKEDDYLPCKEYEGKTINDKQNNVALFKHDNGQFYFVLYRQDGSVRLRSEGFETAEGRDVELSGVLKYSDNKEMYNRIERGDYYIDVLKDKTGREVGRSCLQKVAPPAPPKSKEKEDDYLKCKEYTNRKVNDKVNNVALFKHENGQYYFAIYNQDGSVRLRSEGFGTAKGRDEELSGALKNVNNKDMYETIQKGAYYINVLKDKTGREVGRSCMKKERVPVVPVAGAAGGSSSSSSSLAAGGALLAGTVASKVVGGGKEHKASKLKEKVAVPAAVPKPEAPKAKDYHSPPPPPKEVKVVAAAAAPKAAAAAGGGFNWRWLLPLLLLIPLLLWWMGGCNGCNKATPPPPPPVVKDTIKKEVPPPPVKTALCPAAGDMKLAAGAGSNVCSYLSDPESSYPKRFTFDKVSFSRNGARLNSAGRKSLDDLAVCLKGCENASVDIYGYIGERESSSYRGSKEVSLDDVRARSVYDYLKKRGISDSRMSFQGEGTGDSSNIVVQISE